MDIVIASSNKGKIKEIKVILNMANVIPYSDFKKEIEIIEDGSSFEENAFIKAKAVWEYLKDENIDYVLADDSGLIVPEFNGEPGIHSARYAGENASDKDNNKKIIKTLNEKDMKETKAYYFSAICLFDGAKKHISTGYLYGKIINKTIGSNGFGYDSLFIPNNMSQTLGEISLDIKKTISHRLEALNKIRNFLE
jgi:XTP/dITP diphosphohydrolase